MNLRANWFKVQFLLTVILTFSSNPFVLAGSSYADKAQLLYKFAKNVKWTDNRDTLTFCVMGSNPFGNSLHETIKGKTIAGRELKVKRVSDGSEAADQCNVLFSTQGGAVGGLRGVLTVSDKNGFVKQGGMIEIVTVDNRLRFKVNNTVAKRAGVKITADLLESAQEVN